VVTAGLLSGTSRRAINMVGGGSQNSLLCQRLADHSGLPVISGPVEATAIGNLLGQARAAGLISGDAESLRALVAAAYKPVTYTPSSRGGKRSLTTVFRGIVTIRPQTPRWSPLGLAIY